jgi:hypothetical protein
VAAVELTATAVEDLDRLIAVLSLPPDTRDRVSRGLCVLERLPRLGPELQGRWTGFRFLLGPWRWMIIVYRYEEEDDRVIVSRCRTPAARPRRPPADHGDGRLGVVRRRAHRSRGAAPLAAVAPGRFSRHGEDDSDNLIG